jgi:hypothetical protein
MWTVNLNILQHAPGVQHEGFTKWDTVSIIAETDDNGIVIDKSSFISKLTAKLLLKDSAYYTPIAFTDPGSLNLFWFLQNENANEYICLAESIGDDTHENDVSTILGWDTTIYDYEIELTPAGINIHYDGKTFTLLSNNDRKSSIIGSLYDVDSSKFYFGNGYLNNGSNPDYHEGHEMNHDIHMYLTDAYFVPVSSDEDEEGREEGGVNISDDLANNRTLLPYQYYNFFIHYIRKDGSVTSGFPILTLPVAYVHKSDGNILIPKFNAANPNTNDFVGYFISYEDVEPNVDGLYIISMNNQNPMCLTNGKYLYDIDIIRGDTLILDSKVDETIILGGTKQVLTAANT